MECIFSSAGDILWMLLTLGFIVLPTLAAILLLIVEKIMECWEKCCCKERSGNIDQNEDLETFKYFKVSI